MADVAGGRVPTESAMAALCADMLRGLDVRHAGSLWLYVGDGHAGLEQ